MVVGVAVTVAVHSWQQGGHDEHAGPTSADFVDIADVPPGASRPTGTPDGSAGKAVFSCGRNENNHRNADNVIAAPGVHDGAHHTHEYVGNLSTDGFSTDQSLAAADTTCANGDRSTYYWPVLRVFDGAPDAGVDGNHGRILPPATVRMQFLGSPTSKVIAMPRFLRVVTGDPKALTNGPSNAGHVQWSCSGATDRRTDHYPVCGRGQQVLRIFDFPNCWDGRGNDSPNHHAHIAFPDGNGVCGHGTFPVPQLHVEIGYDVPTGATYAIDTFPDQLHSPVTDHSDFVNVMIDAQMTALVGCLNQGRDC
ncbi:DUF1996 domain-containing protein [Solihabitans fulvus]|uniref:DUF1996 domain-containing protein n=1 Tax=Solihabitans fulvus TaxID=1892852 RepID=A0A5B2WJR4_9PSEU|nr:DUF1996 domain-containing protein [Solihabitans fulvus]